MNGATIAGIFATHDLEFTTKRLEQITPEDRLAEQALMLLQES